MSSSTGSPIETSSSILIQKCSSSPLFPIVNLDFSIDQHFNNTKIPFVVRLPPPSDINCQGTFFVKQLGKTNSYETATSNIRTQKFEENGEHYIIQNIIKLLVKIQKCLTENIQ